MSRLIGAVTLAALLVAGAACGSTSLIGAKVSPSPSVASSPSASPAASPSPIPTPPPDYGPPPAGVDLFYLSVPGSPTWLVGFDWQGHPRATVHLEELDRQTDPYGSGISVAPNGSGFATPVYTFDRLGRLVYQGAPANKGGLVSTWSDDSQLLCGVEVVSSDVDSSGKGTSDYYLVRRPLTGPPTRVSRFLHLDLIPGDMGLTLVAYSHALNRALIVRTVCCGIQGALVLRLSDGALLGTWTRTGGSPVFSPDGQEVADPQWAADGSTLSTEVRLVLGGTVLARYGAGVSFQAFSADNRFAVIQSGRQIQVIEVSTRRVVWRDTQGRKLSRVWPRPGTGDMMLAFTAPPVEAPCPNSSSSQCTNPLNNVVIVHADGSSIGLDGEFIVPMSWG